MKSALLVTAAATLVSAACGNKTYLNPNATVEERVADLLPRMSLREKASQLVQGDMTNYLNLTTGAINETGLEWNMEYRGHAVWTGLAADVEIISKAARVAQNYLVNETKLGKANLPLNLCGTVLIVRRATGIPSFIQSEGLHGFLAFNATIFNSPIAIGCAFNPELVEKMAKVIGVEAKALGVNQLFSPVVDLARELRFGRVEETFGEDAYL